LVKKTNWIGSVSPGRISKSRRQHWPNIEAVIEHFQHKRAFAHWHPDALRDYAEFGTRIENGERVLSFDRVIETAITTPCPTTCHRCSSDNRSNAMWLSLAAHTLEKCAWLARS
jgi:hypothetical protein